MSWWAVRLLRHGTGARACAERMASRRPQGRLLTSGMRYPERPRGRDCEGGVKVPTLLKQPHLAVVLQGGVVAVELLGQEGLTLLVDPADVEIAPVGGLVEL